MNEYEYLQRQITVLEASLHQQTLIEKPDRMNAWTPLSKPAVYASTTSVTFTGVDLTSYLKIGVKCAWYQSGGWRYGYVLSSSYGGGNTTLNFVPNTNYSVAGTDISTFKISYAAPPDFPAKFTIATNRDLFMTGGVVHVTGIQDCPLAGVNDIWWGFTFGTLLTFTSAPHSYSAVMPGNYYFNDYGHPTTGMVLFAESAVGQRSVYFEAMGTV